jgi:hypothetical protein
MFKKSDGLQTSIMKPLMRKIAGGVNPDEMSEEDVSLMSIATNNVPNNGAITNISYEKPENVLEGMLLYFYVVIIFKKINYAFHVLPIGTRMCLFSCMD